MVSQHRLRVLSRRSHANLEDVAWPHKDCDHAQPRRYFGARAIRWAWRFLSMHRETRREASPRPTGATRALVCATKLTFSGRFLGHSALQNRPPQASIPRQIDAPNSPRFAGSELAYSSHFANPGRASCSAGFGRRASILTGRPARAANPAIPYRAAFEAY